MTSADLQGNSVIAAKVASVKINVSIVLQMGGAKQTCAPDVESVNVELAMINKKLDKNAR